MDYPLFCFFIVLSIFFILIVLKKKNILKESFEDAAASMGPAVAKAAPAVAKAVGAPVVEAPATTQAATALGTAPVAQAVQAKEPKKEIPKEDKKKLGEETPAEKGLIFGFLPEHVSQEEPIPKKKNPKTIYSTDSISLFHKNDYLGFSNKNPLLPNLLEKLGTFTPYLYQTVKLYVKTDDFTKESALDDQLVEEPSVPVIYNKSVVCFTVKYLQENYFLQYLPNTSTFYLTKNPSFFLLQYAADTSKESEALYGDTLTITCLDNSEYVMVYEQLLLTEPKGSSPFVIKKSEIQDICLNFNRSSKVDMTQFLPQYLDPVQMDMLTEQYRKEVEDYITKLRSKKIGNLKELQNKIDILQGKLSNANTKLQLQLQTNKLEYESKLKAEQKLLDDQIKAYRKQKETEFEASKIKLTSDKRTKWQKELDDLKKQVAQKCKFN